MRPARPRILLTGRRGQVGWELERLLPQIGEVFAFGREELDLDYPNQIREKIRLVKPQIIVNSAAFTAVDRAEEEPELALAINGNAPEILAEGAKDQNAVLVHYSTDYVFDGTKVEPYTEYDKPNPLNVYGKTKLLGEQAIQSTWDKHYIFRTSWVYGMRGRNFLLTILRLAKERDEIRVVDDQIGVPTWCRTVANSTVQAVNLIQALGKDPRPYGVYNLVSKGQTSWFGFAEKILELLPDLLDEKPRLLPIKSSEYKLPAPRPMHSVLSNQKFSTIFGIEFPVWDESLRKAFVGN